MRRVMKEEFYVGYSAKAPPSLARFVARTSACLLLTGTVIAAVLVFGQRPFANSKFEYGVVRPYEGVLESRPYPVLVTDDARYLLVAPGKHGFMAYGFEGRRVKLDGSLIQRGSDAMLEVAHLVEASGANGASSTLDLGPVTLAGEIVDSKCYLGVMNPGDGKVHRDCATRCISGGIPPAFVVRDTAGESRTLLLAGEDGRALRAEVLDFVAEPVELSGQLSRVGSTLVLHANVSRGIKRIARRIP
jgi:hypothetical protein